MNQIMVIHPYKSSGIWAFDDKSVGLVREPFVSGADEIIEIMVKDMPNAEHGFDLIFSAQPFPGYQLELLRRREDFDGYWYYAPSLDKEGWLCPALFKYFAEAPEKLYAQFRQAN